MANRWLKYLAVGLLAVFCLAFARTDTTEKSMVRAVLLEPGQENWTVGLLYQAPDASADSSEVSDGIRFAAAQGPDLERALANAEAALPLTANFRLCDYLLLLPGSGLTTLEEYEALVLARQCGRTGARMAACGFTCAELSEVTEEGGEPLTELLQALKQARRASCCRCWLWRRAGRRCWKKGCSSPGRNRPAGTPKRRRSTACSPAGGNSSSFGWGSGPSRCDGPCSA